MAPKKLLLTGASGYIGGAVLSGLISKPGSYDITALVRNPADAPKIAALGVKTLLGSIDDDDLLTKAAASSDIVIHTAESADHLGSAQALVRGLKSRGDPDAVYLHTSGTAVLCSVDPIETPFDDEDFRRIHSIPVSAPHRDVDSWVEANATGLRFAIIAPSTINGISPGPVHRVSIQVPGLIRAAIRRGRVIAPGDPSVRWNNVHIKDLRDLYLLILDGLVDGTAPSGPQDGFYIGATHETAWGTVYEALGKVLHERGLVDTPDVSVLAPPVTSEEFGPAVGSFLAESRGLATRGRKLGWKPSRPDIVSTLGEEVDYLVATEKLARQV